MIYYVIFSPDEVVELKGRGQHSILFVSSSLKNIIYLFISTIFLLDFFSVCRDCIVVKFTFTYAISAYQH